MIFSKCQPTPSVRPPCWNFPLPYYAVSKPSGVIYLVATSFPAPFPLFIFFAFLFLFATALLGSCSQRWAEAPIKIARMTLTIKLDGNWSSFQLANNTPPLSVTGNVIAPSARIEVSERSGE